MTDDWNEEDELWDNLTGRILEYSMGTSHNLASVLFEIFQKLPSEDAKVLLNEKNVYFICPQSNAAMPFTVYAPAQEEKKECEIWEQFTNEARHTG